MTNEATARQQRSRGLIGYDSANRATSSLETLSMTFRQLDLLFRNAIERACQLRSLPPMGPIYDDWRADFLVTHENLSEFANLIGEDKNSLQYIRDLRLVAFWELAIDYMELEHNGFPGRMSLKDGGRYKQFPSLPVSRSGWSRRIDEVEGIAANLPRQVLDAVTKDSIQDELLFTGIHKRIGVLDRFLDRTYLVSHSPRDSFGMQIDRSWPWATAQREPFSRSSKPATAYPGNQKSNSMTALVICIVSVISGVLAWLSFIKTLEKGSWDDADFYSLCQGALMQISGIGIMLSTTFFRSARLATQAWRSAWALSILGLISAIIAVPLYGLVRAGYSILLLAVSSIIQTWITLMLMFIVSE